MRRYVVLVCAMASLLLAAASIADATSNLNLSKSNINRVANTPKVPQPVVTGILGALDKLPPGANEAKVQEIVRKHLESVKSTGGQDFIIRVRPVAGSQNGWAVLILENAAEESEAAKLAGVGPTAPHNLKSGYDVKSNKGAPKY
jgi:glycine betaine/choline ABC-type transport system substrate-binding protein